MPANASSILDQLRAHGLVVDDPVIGQFTWCPVIGDRQARGWYSLIRVDSGAGEVTLHGRCGIEGPTTSSAWNLDAPRHTLNALQRESLRRALTDARRHAERMIALRSNRIARAAARVWAGLDREGDAAYLKRRGVGTFGLRFDSDQAAVVPLVDPAGQVRRLQFLRSDECAARRHRPHEEYWPPGAALDGQFHLIGQPDAVLLLAKDYATAATLHMATGLPVAAAFDASNLIPAARALAKRYPSARILVCADDDAFTEGNPGVTAASTAAMEVNGAWVKPVFGDVVARRAGAGESFHHLAHAQGLRVVGAQLEDKLAALKWPTSHRSPKSTAAESAEGDFCIKTVEDMLPRYALIYGNGGTAFDRRLGIITTLSDMRDIVGKRHLHREWMEHPQRQIVRISEVGFDPTGADPAITCNLFRGWPTTPHAGNCERLLELLWYMTGRESDRKSLFDWLLRWIAYPIQHPGAKMKTTVVLHGPQGAGKNLFFEALMGIYGQYGRIVDQAAIEDKFNDWASRKLFLIADEVVARSDLYHVKNKLKSFITGDWIRINPKNIAAYDERNHVNLVFLSNEAQPVVLDEDDRRHAVIWTPDRCAPEVYQAVVQEIRDGGIAALHDHLLKVDLGDFTPATLPPYTDAKRELIDLSLDSTSQFFYALETREIPIPRMAPALSQDVYDVYRVWCARTGMRPASMPRLLSSLDRRHRTYTARKRYLAAGSIKGPHTMLLFGGGKPPNGLIETSWLGECVEAFKTAAADYVGRANAH